MKTLILKTILLFAFFTFFGCSKDSGSTTPTPTCPQGYTGTNCSFQVTPSKINISKIQIVSFPLIDPNAVTGYWDYPTNKDPDIAIILTDNTSGIVLDDESNYPFANATSNFTYSYTFSNLLVTNPLHSYKIEMRDMDDNHTYETMDTYYFTIYSTTNNFPSVITIDSGISKYNIYVSYTW